MGLLILLFFILVSGCTSVQQTQCQENLKTIEDAYARKEFDTVKYLELKTRMQQYCNQYTFRSRLGAGFTAAGNATKSSREDQLTELNGKVDRMQWDIDRMKH